MAPKGAIRNQKGCGTVSSALASAAFEWFLMFLLFLDGMFSYLVTKFASFSQLQTPCLLCSRLDHIFGGKKPGFYNDLICEAHKSEISSLVYCRIHEKLAEAHGTCEPCFLSSVRENKQNPKVCPSFCGTVVQDLEFLVEDGSLVADHLVDSSSPRRLSGCSSPFSGKTFVHKSVQTELVIKEATLQEKRIPDIEKEHSWTRQYTSNKRTGKVLDSSLRSSGFDQLSHIGYTELKISSDTESEYPISDDEDRTLIHEVDYLKEDVLAQNEHLDSGPSDLNILPEVPSIDLAPEKLIHQTPDPEPLDLVSDEQLNVSAPVSSSTLTSNLAIGHGLEELNWDKVKGRCASSGNILQSSEQVSEEKLNMTEIGEDTSLPVKESIEVKPGNGPTSNSSALPLNHNLNSSTLSGATSLDINEAYKLAIGYQANHHPLPELITSKDAARIQEELKMLLSQISASCGFEFAWNDMSPRVQASVDDVKTSETSATAAPSALSKRLSIERNESGFESLDGSIVSDIEGESAVDRLKRQIELDRKSMAVLYKELEEERSASAIAANQAMAMINRLQEEKAAMQMEALQYQRMMDEQAEYDQEDLQKANECLAQKDKELQDLEAELECYRRRFEEDSAEEKILEPMTSFHETICPSNSPLIEITAKENGDSDGNKITQTSLLDFQDEKLYILKCLKRLEKKLHLFSNHGIHSGVSDFDRGFPDINDENAKLQGFKGEQIETEDVVDENGGSCNKEALAVNGENLLVANDVKLSPDACGEPDFSSVETEISRLNERLLTLEADREFLEHTINSLRNGNEGVQFIREIATHLQELRRIGIRSKETAVP